MEPFAKFKNTLKRSVSALKGKSDPSVELLKAVETADNWDTLENRLVELRALSRKRQQEIVDGFGPLVERIEALLDKAKATKVKVIKQSILRQADGYIQELEVEDEPAKVHAANCKMLTNILKQVKRARAMTERGIEPESIDAIATHVEEIVVAYESTLESAGELEAAASESSVAADVDTSSLEKRMANVYETPDTAETDRETEPEDEKSDDSDIEDIKSKLYE